MSKNNNMAYKLHGIRQLALLPAAVALALTLQYPLAEAADADYANMEGTTWPMLPGENISNLAKLFYPDDKAMQKRFIEATLVLSRQNNPDLTATISYSQPNMIIIPDLKALSAKAPSPKKLEKPGGRLHLSQNIGSTILEEATPEMIAEYEALVVYNEKLKVELEKLNAKLEALAKRLAELKKVAEKWMEQEIALRQKQAEEELAAAKKQADQAKALVPDPVKLSPEPATVAPAVTAPEPEPVIPPAEVASPEPKPQGAEASVDKKAKKSDKSAKLKKKTKPKQQKKTEEDSHFQWLSLALFGALLGLALMYTFRKKLPFRLFQATTKDEFVTDGGFKVTVPGSISDTVLENLEKTMQPPNSVIEEGALSVTDQARQLVTNGQVEDAIDLLKEAIREEPRKSITMWLYLLDLYRNQGRREDFEALADNFHHSFNVMTPLWDPVEVNMVIASSIEEFPHLLEELQNSWQNGYAEVFLDNLLSDNREGERAGFSMMVLEEIILLKGIWGLRQAA